MSIRQARHDDIPAIAALWNDMILNTLATFNSIEFSHDQIAQIINDRPTSFWVCGDSAEGFVTWSQFRKGTGYRHVAEHTVIAQPGRGLGSALMKHAFHEAAQQGHRSLVAGISSANPRAVAFHEHLGFKKVGHLAEVGQKSDQWLDLIFMQKHLKAP